MTTEKLGNCLLHEMMFDDTYKMMFVCCSCNYKEMKESHSEL